MSTWYYYDNDGQKQGPVTGGQLKWLAKNGKITSETTVETEEGKTAPARKVKGLTFGAAEQPEVPPSVEPNPFTVVPPVATTPSVDPSPFTAAAPAKQAVPQSVPMPSAKGGKSSLLITFIGIIAVLAVGWVGWTVIKSTAPPAEQAKVEEANEKNVAKLLPAEQTEADSYVTKYGRDAILYYMEDTYKDTDRARVLRYVKYFSFPRGWRGCCEGER